MKQQVVNKPNQIIGPAQQQLPKMTFVTSRVPQALPLTVKLPDLPLPNIEQLSISNGNTYASDFSPMTIDDAQYDSGSESDSSSEDIVDIDYWDVDDPRAVCEYVEEIYDYLRKREVI